MEPERGPTTGTGGFHGLDVQRAYAVIEQLKIGDASLSFDDTIKLKNQFWEELRDEVSKINFGFKDRERLCVDRFRLFDFAQFMTTAHRHKQDALAVFQSAVRKVYPAFEKAQVSKPLSDGDLMSTVFYARSEDNEALYQAYHSFSELLRDVHLLRDFILQTFNILQIVVSELRLQCPEDCDYINEQFADLVNLPMYTSSCLSKLCTRSEVVATALLCASHQCPPQRTAFVCFGCHVLSPKIYVLRCFHRYCNECVARFESQGTHECENCQRPAVFCGLSMDKPLTSFIQSHFIDECLFKSEELPSKLKNIGVPAYMIPKALLVDKHSISAEPMPASSKHCSLPPSSMPMAMQMQMSSATGGSVAAMSAEHMSATLAKYKQAPSKRQRRPELGTPTHYRAALAAKRRKVSSGSGVSTVVAADDTRSPSVDSRAKTSCHQCKNNKDPGDLIFCKNVKWGPGKKKGNYVLKHCRKKFCSQCMAKYEGAELVDLLFSKQSTSDLSDWKCPACSEKCECAACWRRRNVAKKSGDSPQRANAAQTPRSSSHGSVGHMSSSRGAADGGFMASTSTSIVAIKADAMLPPMGMQPFAIPPSI